MKFHHIWGVKQKNSPYMLRDADVMTAAFKEYTGQTLNKDKKPSVRKKLQQAITKSLAKHRELEKTKGKEKEPSL